MKKILKMLVITLLLGTSFVLVACENKKMQPVAVDIVASVEVDGNLQDVDAVFSFVLETVSHVLLEDFSDSDDIPGMPLPDESLQIGIVEGESMAFGEIVFEHAGTFVYRVVQVEFDAEDELIFDNRAFYVTIVVSPNEGGLVADVEYLVNDSEVDDIVFINTIIEAPYVGESGIPENYAIEISSEEALSDLVLVNRHFRLSSDFSPPDLVVVNALNIYGTTNQWITMRATAARALEDMLDAAYDEEEHVIIIVSGYRSYDTQMAVHNNHIADRGEAEARRISARPGHSEHQLGLAMDLSTFSLGGELSSQFSSTPEGAWIRDNAHRFGFIIRYPANREADTGFIYEPWHLRYVGVDTAGQMFGTDMILEEFLIHAR